MFKAIPRFGGLPAGRKKNAPGQGPGAPKERDTRCIILGNLAVIVPLERDGRPMALRPRLSTGLPVSDDRDRSIQYAHVTTPPKTRVKGLWVDKYVRC